jgi:hypothetical protein
MLPLISKTRPTATGSSSMAKCVTVCPTRLLRMDQVCPAETSTRQLQLFDEGGV